MAFDQLKDLYKGDEEFAHQWRLCQENLGETRFKIQDVFFFDNRNLFQDHLSGYNSSKKYMVGVWVVILEETKYSASRNEILLASTEEGCHQICTTLPQLCQQVKGSSQNSAFYTPLTIPVVPWVDISMDFVTGSPRTLGGMIPFSLWWTDFQKNFTLFLVEAPLMLVR